MQDLYRAIHTHPEFKKLEAEKARLGWSLTIAVLAVYFTFILIVAFRPGLFAMPILSGYTTTWGIPAGLFVIIFSFILTGWYVHRANTRFDPERESLIRDIRARMDNTEESA